MKTLVRAFMRWVMIVFLVLDFILLSVIVARCQSVHERHPDYVDAEDTIRFMSVIFISKDDKLIYWKRETRYELILSSTAYDDKTKLEGKLDGRICIIYCKTHLYAYLITQCK